MITSVDADFTLVKGPPELKDALRAHATRCLRALQPPAAGDQALQDEITHLKRLIHQMEHGSSSP
ncbi:hypothetical protein GCM10027074_67240 [Streptomyces deserti]